ncbi:MAG: uracil-DNA glycosylase family protein [Alphaproteobacteria bacterium]|nr:uracil-DNA glycosylase family protein [Alphaproteobacteria bacterium]
MLAEARACRLCVDHLPLGPRPVLRASVTARLLIVGQAPGTRVHATGIPFNDPSGDRLRDWLGIGPDIFYDESRVAIMPSGFCYPGRGRGGDLPPRPECAPTWHPRLLPLMPEVKLTVLIGAYAQAYYLGDRQAATLTETVQRWRDYLPDFLPTPHPSPRNLLWLWLRRRPWFEVDIVPELRRRVRKLLEL